ncbi:DUF86 domain-containing protein [Candidatus Woesearchaeota archaeon]|nr:DUF86 domain-containing protein [Candidatus Woesearchaeota archaeon]
MDNKRILSKIDELEQRLDDLDKIIPENFEDYKEIKTKAACERLLQISIEIVIDICNLISSELKLGLPAEEENIFDNLEKRKIIDKNTQNILIKMKGFRNILVHRYGEIEDELVFEFLNENLSDFDKFKEEILKIIK